MIPMNGVLKKIQTVVRTNCWLDSAPVQPTTATQMVITSGEVGSVGSFGFFISYLPCLTDLNFVHKHLYQMS